MKLKYFQKGFNFSQDGPGNRLVYHLQGCNLRCPWCANPEGIAPDGVLMTGDKINAEYCTRGAISDNSVDRSLCSGCPAPCADNPASGIKRSFIEEDIDEIVRFCESCSMMFFDGGGVTLTGGEPTMQFEALCELLRGLKAVGINTALECNATHGRLPELFELVDFLITDCKHYDSARHRDVCGVGNEAILDNISAAAAGREQLLVRIPLISGFNAGLEDAERFAALFEKIGSSSCRYEFLRYHEFGKDKYKRCGMEYTMTSAAGVDPQRITDFTEIFKKHSLQTIHT